MAIGLSLAIGCVVGPAYGCLVSLNDNGRALLFVDEKNITNSIGGGGRCPLFKSTGQGDLKMRTFVRDHRENDILHRLYVRYALEELQVIDEFIERMNDFSRLSASIIIGLLIEAKRSEILEDAAWFEAAALRAANADVSDYWDEE